MDLDCSDHCDVVAQNNGAVNGDSGETTAPFGSGHGDKYWHERAAFQRSALGHSTTGNDVVATIVISLFFPFPPPLFSSATFSHRRSARIKKLI